MVGSKTEFDVFLEREAQKVRGVYFPVKTGLLRRLAVRKTALDRLHPNPEDEFCMPKIGPNYRIISDYQQRFVDSIQDKKYYYTGEPIIVERTHPDGYMIVNGHHRWAAARRLGRKNIPIRIVNLMHEADVRRILEKSGHTKRAALDLDEVIFRAEDDAALEKKLPFPWNRMYKERIRLGVPALFHFLAKNGYDIWLYSAQYYSFDTIQNLFRRYHVRINGVISAIGKRQNMTGADGTTMEKMISNRYLSTVHIDSDSILRINSETKEFQDFTLSGGPAAWSQEVMDVIAEMEKRDGGAGAAS